MRVADRKRRDAWLEEAARLRHAEGRNQEARLLWDEKLNTVERMSLTATNGVERSSAEWDVTPTSSTRCIGPQRAVVAAAPSTFGLAITSQGPFCDPRDGFRGLPEIRMGAHSTAMLYGRRERARVYFDCGLERMRRKLLMYRSFAAGSPVC
jgi:hypothetical protein